MSFISSLGEWLRKVHRSFTSAKLQNKDIVLVRHNGDTVVLAISDEFYPITGGTIQGNSIEFTGSSPHIGPNTTDTYLRLYNTNFSGGASLYLIGKDIPGDSLVGRNEAGVFRLNAHDGINYHSLIGYPDGRLEWDGTSIFNRTETSQLTSNGYRPIFVSYLNDTSKIVYDSNFQYAKNSGVLISDANSRGYRLSNETYELAFVIGSTGVNRGIYDTTNSKWILYADATKYYFNGHTIEADVPSNAVFTDTTYPLGNHIDLTNSAPYVSSGDTSKYLRLYNTDFTGGASLYLYGKDFSGTDGGIFRLTAHDGSTYHRLEGRPDGALKWRGYNVLTDAVSYAKVDDLPSLYTSINFSSTSVPNTTYTNLGSFTPSKTGKWLFIVSVSIDANANGYRRLVSANSATGNYPDRFRYVQTDGTTANSTLLQLSWLWNCTSISTVYFNVYQTSGMALNASGGYRAYYLGG